MTCYARPEQPLSSHLRAVAQLAREFAQEAQPTNPAFQDQAYWAGLVHDFGKYSDAFQELLRKVTLGHPKWLVEHSGHGAALATEEGCFEIAFAIAGHHAGLPDLDRVKCLRDRPEFNARDGVGVLERAHALLQMPECKVEIPELSVPWPSTPKTAIGDRLTLDLRIRMLFSCLIDADRLDSERFAAPGRSESRQSRYASLYPARHLQRLLSYVEELGKTPETELNRKRADVLEACLRASEKAQGCFSLTVPTGGGKTLAAMAFALRHAAVHGLERVIVVIPYLSIIEQNAGVYRDALGHEEADGRRVVLEHHSAVQEEGDDESLDERVLSKRLAAENWQAPVVVTTSVQFFESLFSDRPSVCRKLHNIARSVVILDEVQTFPPDMLEPILSMVKALSRDYGVTFVFCTATQPAFEIHDQAEFHPDPQDRRWEPGTLREIVSDHPALFHALKRVDVQWPDGGSLTPWSEVAQRMVSSRTALCIVNTKEQARRLFSHLRLVAMNSRLPEEALFHLSAWMCPQHRMDLLGEGRTPLPESIRARLSSGEPCLVVSTQLVEAGVDVDFPAVWRALGPLDSIAQAAGRCNREGRLKVGQVIVFRTEDAKLPPDAYKQATQITEMLLKEGKDIDLHDPDIFRRYFNMFYGGRQLDVRGIQALRHALNFPEVSQNFRMIDERLRSVVVPYKDGKERIARLRSVGRMTRDLGRALQRYTVGLYEHEWLNAVRLGAVREIGETGTFEYVLGYHPKMGITLAETDPMSLIIGPVKGGR